MERETEQASEAVSPAEVFDLLEGTWQGEGKGEFPTIESFAYRETLTFERPDDASLFYVQRTERFIPGQAEPVSSHWESGFLGFLDTDELLLANAQIGGRVEVLAGAIEKAGDLIRLRFKSTAVANDERMVATTRVFEIESDTVRYEQAMATTRVGELTRHVFATLRRV